jgi:hypothetical protein
MDERENTFPMDVTEPSSRPWNFRPQGYLVMILAGTEEAQRAETALVEQGFGPEDVKLYTGEQSTAAIVGLSVSDTRADLDVAAPVGTATAQARAKGALRNRVCTRELAEVARPPRAGRPSGPRCARSRGGPPPPPQTDGPPPSRSAHNRAKGPTGSR